MNRANEKFAQEQAIIITFEEHGLDLLSPFASRNKRIL